MEARGATRGAAPSRLALSSNLNWLLWAAVDAVAVGGAISGASGNDRPFLIGLGVAAVLGIVNLALRSDPAWPLSLGIGASVFSGNSSHMGLPLGPDRLLIAAGLLALVLQRLTAHAAGERLPPLRVEPVHWVLFAAGLWAIGSAYWAGTLTQQAGLFSLLDRFGLVPFTMFLVAPLAFRTDAQRRILLGTLAVTGAYLSLTALFETVHLKALIFPKYIDDPSVGIHWGRARGPFVEAVGDGLGMIITGTAAFIASRVWSDRRWVRLGGMAVALLSAAGVLFTLTRGVWLAAILAVGITALGVRELWRYLLPIGATAVVIVLLAFAAIPSLASHASSRQHDNASIQVRDNTNRAAMRMIAHSPLTGYGWNSFQAKSPDWFWQARTYPINGVGEGVHNALLSNAVDLGLIGAGLWLGGLVMAIGGALVRRPTPELRLWRIGLALILIAWLTAAAVGPVPYAFPLLVLWTWAGVLWSGRSRSVRTHSRGPEPAANRA